jgi:malate synthase
MLINALNSGAPGFMADFEDSNSPTWLNMIGGQVNLLDAVRHRLEFDDPEKGPRVPPERRGRHSPGPGAGLAPA